MPSRRWSPVPNIRNIKQRRARVRIRTHADNVISPPVNLNSGPLKCKEGDNGRNGDTTVERGRQDVVVLLPPRKIVLPDIDLEEVGNRDRRPGVRQVVWCPVKRARKQDGNVNGANELVIGPSLGKEIEWNGQESTDEESPEEDVVRSITSVHPGGAQSSPDDRGGEEGGRSGAVELGLSVGCADSLDASHLPVEQGHSNRGRDDSGNCLGSEHDTRWYLHVVTKLEILSKG